MGCLVSHHAGDVVGNLPRSMAGDLAGDRDGLRDNPRNVLPPGDDVGSKRLAEGIAGPVQPTEQVRPGVVLASGQFRVTNVLGRPVAGVPLNGLAFGDVLVGDGVRLHIVDHSGARDGRHTLTDLNKRLLIVEHHHLRPAQVLQALRGLK